MTIPDDRLKDGDDDMSEAARATSAEEMVHPPTRRAVVVGTGLIGGSMGLALKRQGWHVSGIDIDDECSREALDIGAIDRIGIDEAADLGIVATPVGSVAHQVGTLLDAGVRVVTDVGSVKSQIVGAIHDPRFVGGHPMAGSEQVGLSGARADLFEGAAWVLTPGPETLDQALVALRGHISSIGAEPLTLDSGEHDRLVAMVSHVPHLTAASLMRLAGRRSSEHRALLRLAAGGFRDMTRIAAGHPGIWPDICEQNSSAVVEVLDELIESLTDLRRTVHRRDREALLVVLEEARQARMNLPVTGDLPSDIAEVRVPIPDRPGAAAEVMVVAARLGLNILDMEIAHSGEGDAGVLLLVMETSQGEDLVRSLAELAYAGTVNRLQ